jgi:hypothetical protein
MSTRHTVLSIALLIASAGILLPATANAASVYSITGDDLKMNTLGSEYIHSRHIGLMPYWGPCYRCETKYKEQCSASNNSSNLVTYSGDGRAWTVKDDNCTWFMDIDSGQYANEYDSTLSWNNSTKSFSGYLNFTGTSEIGYLCGGNSGIEGSGSSIFPMNSPIGTGGCSPNNQGATGQPLTLVNGKFVGGPITIGNVWGNWTITATGSCLAVSYNGAQEGDLCAFTTTSYQSCRDHSPTSSECQVPYKDGPVG